MLCNQLLTGQTRQVAVLAQAAPRSPNPHALVPDGTASTHVPLVEMICSWAATPCEAGWGLPFITNSLLPSVAAEESQPAQNNSWIHTAA